MTTVQALDGKRVSHGHLNRQKRIVASTPQNGGSLT